jgi:hypothetical protein
VRCVCRVGAAVSAVARVGRRAPITSSKITSVSKPVSSASMAARSVSRSSSRIRIIFFPQLAVVRRAARGPSVRYHPTCPRGSQTSPCASRSVHVDRW